MTTKPRRQRVAAYAVIVRDGEILLSRLSSTISDRELWTLPGGGLDHGEHPREAVVREVYEETGLAAEVGDRAWIYSVHRPDDDSRPEPTDFHALGIIYTGAVAADSPPPQVIEVDGSTVEARWIPLADVASGATPVVNMVSAALDALT